MHIQMEITLRCNGNCMSCSRHCRSGIYDESSDVTLEQVERFCDEVRNSTNVDLVSIMGGEPTIHPGLDYIISAIQLLQVEGHIKRCQVVTNGKEPVPDAYLYGVSDTRIATCVEPLNSPMREAHHRCMYVAPKDTGQMLKDCPVPVDCGVSWGAYGWWPCGAGGAIARLFGWTHYRRQKMPKDIWVDGGTDDWPDDMRMCLHCQCKAETYMFCRTFGDIRSVSFRKAFREFDAKRLEKY